MSAPWLKTRSSAALVAGIESTVIASWRSLWIEMCFVFSPKFQSPNSKFSPFKPKSKSKSLAFESKSKSNSSKIGLESDLSPSPGLESYNSTALPLNVYADILNFLSFCRPDRYSSSTWAYFHDNNKVAYLNVRWKAENQFSLPNQIKASRKHVCSCMSAETPLSWSELPHN